MAKINELDFTELKKFIKSRTARIAELQIEVDTAKILICKKAEAGDFGKDKSIKKKVETPKPVTEEVDTVKTDAPGNLKELNV